MIKIKDLNHYVLFVFNDLTNDKIVSTADVEFLKKYTLSESFNIGDTISFLEHEYTIKNISISKVGTSLNSDHDYGWSIESISPQGIPKDILFSITISMEERLD